jgi:hypothetical protein
MKKLLIALAAVLVTSASSYGQGTIFFATRNTGVTPNVVAPVFMPNSTTEGPGPTFSAQLFLVGAGGALTAIPTSLTTFQAPGTGGAAILNRFVVPTDVVVPGVAGGTAVQLRMRAWQTAAGSYEASLIRGENNPDNPISLTLGGAGQPPGPPADLPSSFTGFTLIVVPEPSTIALGVLGAAALLIRRRK